MDKIDKDWYKHAILREGEVLKVYKDSLGKPTGGIGHLILPEDNLKVGDKISKELSMEWFKKDSAKARAAAEKQAKEIGAHQYDWFIVALISVNFQLGTQWRNKFKNTWDMIAFGDYDGAIKALRKSLWYKQTPVRVEDFINALEKLRDINNRPLAQSRTIQGGAVAAASVLGQEAAVVAEQIEPLADYSDTIRTVFVVLTVIGILIMLYARVDDRKNGKR